MNDTVAYLLGLALVAVALALTNRMLYGDWRPWRWR